MPPAVGVPVHVSVNWNFAAGDGTFEVGDVLRACPPEAAKALAAYRRSVDRFLSLRRDVVEDEEDEAEAAEAAEAAGAVSTAGGASAATVAAAAVWVTLDVLADTEGDLGSTTASQRVGRLKELVLLAASFFTAQLAPVDFTSSGGQLFANGAPFQIKGAIWRGAEGPGDLPEGLTGVHAHTIGH